MNHEANQAYAEKSVNDGRLDMPVLFLHGAYDYTCETIDCATCRTDARRAAPI